MFFLRKANWEHRFIYQSSWSSASVPSYTISTFTVNDTFWWLVSNSYRARWKLQNGMATDLDHAFILWLLWPQYRARLRLLNRSNPHTIARWVRCDDKLSTHILTRHMFYQKTGRARAESECASSPWHRILICSTWIERREKEDTKDFLLSFSLLRDWSL